MNTGAYAGAAMSPRNKAAHEYGRLGRGRDVPAQQGGLSSKLLRWQWGPIAILRAQQGGYGAHEYGRLCRGRDVPAQQGGLSSRGVGPPAEAGDLIRAKSLGRKWEPLAVNFFRNTIYRHHCLIFSLLPRPTRQNVQFH